MIASFITALYLLGFLSASSAVTSLVVAGVLLLVAEIAVVSFGLLALNGAIALYAAFTIYYGNDFIFGIGIGWPVLFGIAFVEFFTIIAIVTLYTWLRKRKTTTGTEAMIGEKAVIITWSGKKGSVRIDGEIWKAQSGQIMDLNPDEEVTVEAVNKLSLTITA